MGVNASTASAISAPTLAGCNADAVRFVSARENRSTFSTKAVKRRASAKMIEAKCVRSAGLRSRSAPHLEDVCHLRREIDCRTQLAGLQTGAVGRGGASDASARREHESAVRTGEPNGDVVLGERGSRRRPEYQVVLPEKRKE